MQASISIKGHNVTMLIKIQKSEKDETQSLFFQLKQQLFALFSCYSLSSQQIPTNFYYSVLYLMNILLDYSTVSCEFDIRF